jgi:iron complex outermembrane receptor protein
MWILGDYPRNAFKEKLMRISRLIAWAAILSALWTIAWDFDRASLAQDDISLGTILVTEGREGSRETGYKPTSTDTVGPFSNRPILDAPYSVNVMSSELLETMGATEIDEVLMVNPVVQLTYPSDRGLALFNVRGFMLAQTSGRLFDGLRKYTYFIPLEDKERAEVISGLSGFLYGPAAVGGAVNYVYKKPTPEATAVLRFKATERGGVSPHLDLGGPIGESGRLGYRLNVAGRLGKATIKDQKNENLILSSTFEFKATEDLLLRLTAYQYRSRIDNSSAVFQISGKRPKAFDPDSTIAHGGGLKTTSTGYIAGANWKINDYLSFRAAFQQSNEDMAYRRYRYTAVNNGVIRSSLVRNVDRMRGNQLSSYAYFDVKFPTGPLKHEMTVGYSMDKTSLFSGPSFVKKTTQSSDTVYQNYTIGDIISIGDKWQLLGGLTRSSIMVHNFARNDYYRTFELSPSVSLLFKPMQNITLYGTYMESLEQGTLVSNSSTTGKIYTNNGEYLPPFQSQQYEFGVKAELGNVLLTLALYDIVKDYTVDKLVADNLYTQTQDGRERHKGIELTATGKITENLTVYSGLTFMKARVEDAEDKTMENNRPTNTAEKMFKLFLEYDLQFFKGFSVNGGLYYIGPSYADAINADKLPGYTVYDLGASYATEIKGYPFKINLSVHNVADKNYWQSGSYLGAPRTFLLSAMVRFK